MVVSFPGLDAATKFLLLMADSPAADALPSVDALLYAFSPTTTTTLQYFLDVLPPRVHTFVSPCFPDLKTYRNA